MDIDYEKIFEEMDNKLPDKLEKLKVLLKKMTYIKDVFIEKSKKGEGFDIEMRISPRITLKSVKYIDNVMSKVSKKENEGEIIPGGNNRIIFRFDNFLL